MKNDNPLGQKTPYNSQYDPGLLFPIKRTVSRDALGLTTELPFRGEDRWTAYEVSWLDAQGKPQIRLAEFVVPADSPCIIESKSFKLYLNSYNQTVFENERTVLATMASDLSNVAGAAIVVRLLPLHYANQYSVQEPIGTLLDNLSVDIRSYTPIPEVLRVSATDQANEVICSHLLKTNCPVTGQPDWASVFIEYTGQQIQHESILEYLISFREHQDYHENSIEQIFCDINDACQPKYLGVYARYLRRGGLDINPLRSSYPKGKSLLEANSLRTIRQ